MFARLFAPLFARVKRLERSLLANFVTDITTPASRRAAWWHFQLMDHAFLRVWWTNFAEVAPGVFRSNQPSPKRLASYHRRGIRTIISLRGENVTSAQLFEREACEKIGMNFLVLGGFSARRAPSLATMMAFVDAARAAEKPMLIHCKSGSDRAGLASALYLLLIENRPVAEAAKQLSFRFLHMKSVSTGVLDHILRVYAREEARNGITFRDWLETRYDPAEITQSFADWRKGIWEAT